MKIAATRDSAVRTRTAIMRPSGVIATVGLVLSVGACTWNPWRPPRTTTTSTATTSTVTTSITTTTVDHHPHGDDAPYVSPDDPRLTPDQRQRAKDLIARTREAMRRFPDQASVVQAGYESILDANSGHEHFFHHGYMRDEHILDPEHIEAIVFETKPGQPKRVVAAMYMLDEGTPMSEVPDVAGPLTPWHNHKDLCWDPSRKYVIGVFRLGRCIPLGELHELPPMLHVWIVDTPCGPFAEVDDTSGIVDRYLRDAGLIPTTTRPAGDPCAHVHGGDRTVATTTTTRR